MVEKVPTVDEIATVIIEAIDDYTANKANEDSVISLIKNVVSIKAKRLKILDGNRAKSRFESKMGKGRLEKFYAFLEKAEG
jgi:hypothetical protein